MLDEQLKRRKPTPCYDQTSGGHAVDRVGYNRVWGEVYIVLLVQPQFLLPRSGAQILLSDGRQRSDRKRRTVQYDLYVGGPVLLCKRK